MSKYCTPAPTSKKEYLTDIGKILVEQNGKQKYYKPEQVKKAHKRSSWNSEIDFSCWAMSTYSSHNDFDSYHEEAGEVCDYADMKTEMLSGLSGSVDTDWSNIPDIDIDASWLDFGEVFDGLLEGIGAFIGGIFDNA